ncbi:MAG: type II secretion system protein GspD [Pirellulales bacterium]|nr:type II secretion system protein GspD [Pirellulales bacterium]
MTTDEARLKRPPHGRGQAPALAPTLAALGALSLCLATPVRGQAPERLVAPQHGSPAGPVLEAPQADQSKLPAAAPPARPKIALSEALQQQGDLKLRNSSIEAALSTISEIWGVNLVTGKSIEGTVNCDFKQATLREVLDSILLANGYSYRPVGESLVVQMVADVGSANPLFTSTTIPIRYGTLAEITEAAQLLKSAQGQIRALDSARSLLIVDYEDRVKSIVAFVQRMEESAAAAAGGTPSAVANQLEVVYFHTQYIPAENARPALQAVLSMQGRVAVMPSENRLLVVDYPRNIEMARNVLDRVDRPRPQVKITALIYDLSLQDVEQLGLNWGSAAKGNSLQADGTPSQALQFDTTTLEPFVSATSPGGALTVRSLTRNFDITSVLQLLQSANDARLLANPNVVVLDNEQAEMKSVSEIPYQQITQSELGGQIGTTAFKPAGITLRVRPLIAGDGTIELIAEPEYSRLAGFTPGDNQPIIDTRSTTTRVRVANKQTIVISGLRHRSDTGEFKGIPILKDVKYVGALFRSRNTDVRESELIVFIQPEIVGYDDQNSPREFAARDTIECRLERIPYAEGCGPLGCADEQIMPLPPVEDAAPGQYSPGPVTSTATSESKLRPGFSDRYRANAAGEAQRRNLVPPSPVRQAKQSSWWSRTFGK